MPGIRDFVPPVVVRAARKVRPAPALQPKPAVFYDERIPEKFLVEPRLSPYYFLWTVIADRIATGCHHTVFNLGCGTGQLDRLLYDFGVERLTGLDFAAERVKVARETNPWYSYVVADATTADLRSLDYSAVVCTEFLEHVDDDLGIVARLRPGVRFVGTVPNFGGESHVRHFAEVVDVQLRYAEVLDGLNVRGFDAPDRPGKRFFLLDGIVRG